MKKEHFFFADMLSVVDDWVHLANMENKQNNNNSGTKLQDN